MALQDVHEEEANAAVADAHRVRRPVVDVAPPQEVRFEFGLRDLVGRRAVEGAQHPHRSGVGFLRAFPFAVELQGVDGALVPVGHHGSLLRGKSWGSRRTIHDAPRGEQREAGVARPAVGTPGWTDNYSGGR